MNFNPKTNTILVDETSGSFLRGSGQLFVHSMKEAAELSDAPPTIKRDWKILKNWLQCPDGGIDSETNKRIALAWQSYLAAGVSPSVALEGAFVSFKSLAIREKWLTKSVPLEIQSIFDRMLATDDEIANKARNSSAKSAHPILSEDQLNTLKRVSVVLHGGWLFFALLIANGLVFDDTEGEYAFGKIAFIVCLSAPVVAIYAGNWILQRSKWSSWMLALCVGFQVVAILPVQGYFYGGDAFVLTMICMMLSFAVFYTLQNAVQFWNALTSIVNRRK